MSTTLFQRMRDPPINGTGISPAYDGERDFLYVVLAQLPSLGMGNRGIVKYDLNQQMVIETYPYPNERAFRYVSDARAAIDAENQILYVVPLDTAMLFSLNLRSREWKILVPADELHAWTNIAWIPSPINQLHVTSGRKHYRWNAESKRLVALHQNTGAEGDFEQDEEEYFADDLSKFVHDKSRRRLYMFQLGTQSVLCVDIKSRKQRKFKWEKSRVKLPEIKEYSSAFDIALAWDQILFWFDNEERTIWCLDLSNEDDPEWFQSPQSLPDCELDLSLSIHKSVIDRQNYIHFMAFATFDGNTTDKSSHCKAYMCDLLPVEIIERNKTKFDPLISGFVKQEYDLKQKSAVFVPHYVKKLILNFYPVFL